MTKAESDRVRNERGRQKAEAGRVKAEGQGVSNEPGRREAETGRVDAETGRVDAENLRQSLFDMPAWVPQTRKAAVIAAFCIIVAVAVPSGLLSYHFARSAAEADIEERILAQIATCERVKADRVDNARAWTQAERTWTKRSLDPSLSELERKRAAQAAVIYGESANQLRSRILRCDPLIRDGKSLIDERLLREAKGDL